MSEKQSPSSSTKNQVKYLEFQQHGERIECTKYLTFHFVDTEVEASPFRGTRRESFLVLITKMITRVFKLQLIRCQSWSQTKMVSRCINVWEGCVSFDDIENQKSESC